ncbi:FtsX-like permease family protein [Bacillus sp. NPDC077027]|uniref:FtsX-like permease family protein n=1 Tax=Bacillus sp. NPDC077027 TaxID=3390548 RepID=UPI003D035282
MRIQFIKNDLSRHRLISLGLTLSIVLTTFLATSAAQMTTQLTGAISELLQASKAPHFVQMHDGTLDEQQIETFAHSQPMVQKHQIVSMIPVDSTNLTFGKQQVTAGVMDHLFVKQNRFFDFLLNDQNKKLTLAKGEIAVPIYFQQQYGLRVGEKVDIQSGNTIFSYEIKAFLRDAQMNPSLVSSKRFLLHDEDWAALGNAFDQREYLIEFLLKHPDQADTFQTIYQSSQMPQQGPAVTFSLLSMLNALTDGIVIAILLLVCLLLISIAGLCLRLAITAAVEEDYRDIGILKVLGIPLSQIKQLYLGKYAVLTCIGCIGGYLLSLLLGERFLANIHLYMGKAPSISQHLIPFFIALMTALIVIVFGYLMLRQFRKVSAAGALRAGALSVNQKRQIPFKLHRSVILPINTWFGIKDVFTRFRMYAIATFILVLCTFLMLVPIQLWHTLKSPEFITYLGSGKSDLRIDLRQAEGLEKQAKMIQKYIIKDSDLERFAVYQTQAIQAQTKEKTLETLYLETGNFSLFPLTYLQGNAPKSANEIALSALSATSLDKTINDELVLASNGLQKKLRVTGIYQDVTNGGKTAKALTSPFQANPIWLTVHIEFKQTVHLSEKKLTYEAALSPIKVTDMNAYIDQTIGSTADQVKQIAIGSAIAAFSTASLILMMFLHMLRAKDVSRINLLRTLGFSQRDIITQYMTSLILVLFIGIFLGSIAAETVGTTLMSTAGASLGASKIQWLTPQWVPIVYPLSFFIGSLIVIMLILRTFTSKSSIREILS